MPAIALKKILCLLLKDHRGDKNENKEFFVMDNSYFS